MLKPMALMAVGILFTTHSFATCKGFDERRNESLHLSHGKTFSIHLNDQSVLGHPTKLILARSGTFTGNGTTTYRIANQVITTAFLINRQTNETAHVLEKTDRSGVTKTHTVQIAVGAYPNANYAPVVDCQNK